MARLGDVATVSASTKKLEKGETWLLNLDMVEQQTGRIISYNYVTEEALNGSIVQFDTENVLYSKLRPNLNKVVIPNQPGFASSEMLPLRPDTSILTKEYLAAYLRSDNFVKWATSKTAGSKMPRLGTKELLNKDIPIPSIEKQKNITKMLDNITNLISLRKQQLAKLDELVKARFVEMFGDLIVNPMGWEFQKLKNLCDVRDGTHDSPEYQSNGIPLLTSKHFSSGIVDFSGCNLISEADFEKINRRSKVDYGDIVMPMIGTIGHPVIVDTSSPFAIKNVALIKFNNQDISNVFLKAVLDSAYFLNSTMTTNRGGTQKFISLDDIRNLPIPVVPCRLQIEFADFVCKIERQGLTIQRGLDKLESLKKSLMQEYFG